jgi:hypothetical protein
MGQGKNGCLGSTKNENRVIEFPNPQSEFVAYFSFLTLT